MKTMGTLQLSVEAANRMYASGWVVSIFGAAATLVGVGLLWWSTRVREHDAERRIAAANAEAAHAKSLSGWRTLGAEQYRVLVTELKGKSMEVWTSFVGTDPESHAFRDVIDSALKEAGVKTHYYSGWQVAVGLQLTSKPQSHHALVANAFQKAGIPFAAAGDTAEKFARDRLMIVVGTKPPPFFVETRNRQ
jgi:hypothetical protein